MTEIHAFDPDGSPSPGAEAGVSAIMSATLDPQVAQLLDAHAASDAAKALQDRAWQGTMARFPKLAEDLDDTERLQRAIAWCANAGRGLSLAGDPWASGPYRVRELTIPAGLPLLDLAGATLKRPALGAAPYNYTLTQKKWSRMITLAPKGEVDSPVVMIQDGTLDGNCWENWSDNEAPSYEQEQASLLLVVGDKTNGGRARLRLRGVSFRDSVSDGLHVVNDAVVEATDCTSHDCFRGGLTVTGGGVTINASGWVSTSSRASMPDGVDIEVDSPGYNGTTSLDVNLSSFTIDRDLDVGVPPGGYVSLTDMVLKTPGWTLGARGGTLLVTGGRLAQNETGRLMVRDGARILFLGTQLLGSGPGAGVAMPMQFYAASSTPAQATVTFSGVDFQQCATGISGNLGEFVDVIVTGQTRFGEDVDLAIGGPYQAVDFRPRVIQINGASFGNTGYWLQALDSPTRVEVNGITVTNPANKGARLGPIPLTWSSMVTMSYGAPVARVIGAPVVTGNRTVLVDADPNDSTAWTTGRLFGRFGDVAMLRDRSRRWVCIGYDDRPGIYRHVWEERAVDAKTTGPTADRPATTVVGTQFLDTTLGKPIWWVGTRWVDAIGATV